MKFTTALSLAATLMLSGTFALASNVRTDYDRGVNFSTYHSYSWGQVKTSNPLNKNRIKAAVDRDLQAKGWQLVPSGGGITVFATDNVKNEQEVETMYDGMGGGMGGWGGGWGFGGFGGFGGGYGMGGFGESTTSEVDQRIGHIVVDLFDTPTHHLLFRGVADNDLSDKSKKNTKNMDKDIDKMFKDFPPKS